VRVLFRYKGKNLEKDFLRKDNFPDFISFPPDKDGIDLTGYPVFWCRLGKGGREKAQRISLDNPRVIVIFQYSWRNGFGEGIIFPKKFNPCRIKFYESVEEKRRQNELARREELQRVCDRIELQVPVKASPGNGDLFIRIPSLVFGQKVPNSSYCSGEQEAIAYFHHNKSALCRLDAIAKVLLEERGLPIPSRPGNVEVINLNISDVHGGVASSIAFHIGIDWVVVSLEKSSWREEVALTNVPRDKVRDFLAGEDKIWDRCKTPVDNTLRKY